MKVTRATVLGSANTLAEACNLARKLVEPSEGFASFDVTFVGWLDENGRPTVVPTAQARYHFTYWRSDRKGRYKIVKPTAKPSVFADPRGWLWAR